LEEIDLSDNKLKSLKYLSGLQFLLKIKASNNELTSILDLKKPPLHLDTLDLSNNSISKMTDMSQHHFLRVLILRCNTISVIEGLSKNTNLHILDLSANRLE
jgi:Leucine-rich repeat (LRR) protein